MSPGPRRRTRMPRSALGLVIGAILTLAGCAAPEFDPTGPCTTDGKVPGAYPELEALVPKTYAGAAPSVVDSGRTCTTGSLGTLASHGVTELRFAGSTWPTGTQSGLTLATFESVGGPALQHDWLAEFYETTARTARNVQQLTSGDVSLVDGTVAKRLDVLNDESYQTVVVWKRDDRVVAALVANFIREIGSKDAHEKVVAAALDALAGPVARV